MVSPSENRFFKFTFPLKVTQIVVKSESNYANCLTVAVQRPEVISVSAFYFLLYHLSADDTILIINLCSAIAVPRIRARHQDSRFQADYDRVINYGSSGLITFFELLFS